MSISFAQSQDEIAALVKHFRTNFNAYHAPGYKAAHDRRVELVDTILQLHLRLAAAQTAHDREMIQRQIDATDKQIDALVYQLYGLTDEEIKIVEGK